MLNKIKHAPDAGKSGGLIRQRNRDERAGKTKILIPPRQCEKRGNGGVMFLIKNGNTFFLAKEIAGEMTRVTFDSADRAELLRVNNLPANMGHFDFGKIRRRLEDRCRKDFSAAWKAARLVGVPISPEP